MKDFLFEQKTRATQSYLVKAESLADAKMKLKENPIEYACDFSVTWHGAIKLNISFTRGMNDEH